MNVKHSAAVGNALHYAAKIERNDPCWCGSGKKYKKCHMAFDDKIKGFEMKGHITPDRSLIKTPEQIRGIKESAKINMACLDAVAAVIRAGMTTEEIDRIVYDTTISMNGIPAPLNYEGFPKSVCTSINEEVCHGIPDEKHVLRDGDIINVDCSTIYNGFFSDSSRMFMIGDVSPEKKKLVEVTKECVQIGIDNVIPWTLGSLCQLRLKARRGDADGARNGIYHRADGQYGHGQYLSG